MESFSRGEHVIAAFLDVEKAFDNVWHNGLRYKIYQLDLPTKLCRWLSDFLVGRVIQVKIKGFLSPKVYPKQKFHKVQTWVHFPNLCQWHAKSYPPPDYKSQFADDAGQWAVSKNIDLAAKYLQRDLDKLARWCAKWRIKLNPEKTKVINNIFQVPNCNKGRTCFVFIRWPTFVLSSNKIPRYHLWQ